jgi:DnaD/phage-associated family protein
MILLAAQSVRARGGMFEDLEPKLLTWKQSGFTSEQQVRAHLKELKNHEPLLLLVFEASGQGGRANEGDLIKIRQWLKDGHSEALILEAAAQARSSRIKIPYMAKILDNWKKNGVTTVDAARAQGVPQGGQGRKVGFQQYDQQTDHGLTPALGVDLLREAREQDGQ